MKVFLLLTDNDVWYIIEFGYHEHIITIDDFVVTKCRDKWDANEKKKRFFYKY